MKVYKHIIPFLKKHIHYFFFGVLILIGINSLQLVLPRMLGVITNHLKTPGVSLQDLKMPIFWILLAALFIAIGRFLWRQAIMGTARKLEYWIRNRCFEKLESLPMAYYNAHPTGELMAYLTNDINAVKMSFSIGVVMMVDAFTLLILTLWRMSQEISLSMSLLALIPLPIIAIVILLFGKETMRRFKQVQEQFALLSEITQENLSGIRVIKSFAQEENRKEQYQAASLKNKQVNMALIRLFAGLFPLVITIGSLSLVIALFVGGEKVILGEISLGQFVSFTTYIGLLTWPMMAVGGVVNIIQRGRASMVRLNQILDAENTLQDAPESQNRITEGKIVFQNFSFTYPGSLNPALKDISFSLEQGQTLAIVGKTGSGKTTLAESLVKLYNISDKAIFIDDIDINQIPLRELRQNISFVPQDNILFSKSIRENIAFAKDVIDEKEILAVSEKSQIQDEIYQLPQGFDTLLGERGVNLSGGQKQRISIARALYNRPKILILDDALSAVDTKTEENILSFLKKEMKQATTILISHRISTVKDADLILVLDEGKIIERGTHQSLLEASGAYRSIFEKQRLEDKIAKEA